MRRILRFTGAALAVAALAGAVFLGPTLWGKPWSIDHFFLRSLLSFVLDHPMLLSYARPLDAYGLDFYSDDLEDFSVEANLELADFVDEVLAGLRRYDRAALSPDQQLSYDVLEWLLVIRQEGRRFLYHNYPLNQFDGSQTFLADFMVNIHQVDDEQDAEDYLARLEGFGRALDQLGASARASAERQILPPRFVLVAVDEQVSNLIAVEPEENILYTKFRDSLGNISALSEDARGALLDRARRLVSEVVHPGYDRLRVVLDGLLPETSSDDGVWKLPDGDAYYRWALRWHTTTDRTPDQIHATGLAEITRIHAQMREILASEGLPFEDPIATILELNTQPRFLYTDDDAGRSEILRDYQAIVDDAWERLPTLFGALPEAPVIVERVPVFKEAGSAGAYYTPPSFDGSRPGVFYANLRDVAEIQRFAMRTLAFHEAVPGHHLQIAMAMETDALPWFRRVIPLTAFVEGWALYAERLALDAGFHETPYDQLGALSAEVFRAARLVVDTGIHAKRWTRAEAIEYLIANAGLPRGDATAEVERYIVAPGQACAYKMGQLGILDLRERAEEHLGEAFDLRAFNDLLLGNGALPLSVLGEVVDRWSASYSR
jgi:uncharacterized protein (DUF885 family)